MNKQRIYKPWMMVLLCSVTGLMPGTALSDTPPAKHPPMHKPPVNNTVPPCDESATSPKPSCRSDSDSIKTPPQPANEKGVIVPPEIPAEGLPNREPNRRPEDTQPTPGHERQFKN